MLLFVVCLVNILKETKNHNNSKTIIFKGASDAVVCVVTSEFQLGLEIQQAFRESLGFVPAGFGPLERDPLTQESGLG